MYFRSILSGTLAILLVSGAIVQADERVGLLNAIKSDTPRAVCRCRRSACPKLFGGKEKPAGDVELAQAGDPRITALEEQVRALSGTIEELNFQILQMQEQMRQDAGRQRVPLPGTRAEEDGRRRPAGNKAPADDKSRGAGRPASPPAAGGQDGSRGESEEAPGAPMEPEVLVDNGTGDPAEVPSGTRRGRPRHAPKEFGTITFDDKGNVTGGSVGDQTTQSVPSNADTAGQAPVRQAIPNQPRRRREAGRDPGRGAAGDRRSRKNSIAIPTSSSCPATTVRRKPASAITSRASPPTQGRRRAFLARRGAARPEEVPRRGRDFPFGQQGVPVFQEGAGHAAEARRVACRARPARRRLRDLLRNRQALSRHFRCAEGTRQAGTGPGRVLTAPPGIEFSGLFSPFDLASRSSVIAAVSGGSDSTALLLLLKDHLDRSAPGDAAGGRDRRPCAAAGIGGRSRSRCAALREDSACHIDPDLDGRKPATGLAAAAREARHELLAEAALARKDGSGSHRPHGRRPGRDRADAAGARRPGRGRGLAGIAPATLFDGKIWFARPLLGYAPRSTCAIFSGEQRVGWIDDPTNVNQRYERPRVRKKLGEAGGETAIADALEDCRRSGRKARGTWHEAARTHSASMRIGPLPDLLRLRAGFLPEAARRGRRLCAAHPARCHRRNAASARRRRGRPRFMQGWRQASTPFGPVAGACRCRGKLACSCCARRAACRTHNRFGSGMVWDGRYRIAAASPGFSAGPPTSPLSTRKVQLGSHRPFPIASCGWPQRRSLRLPGNVGRADPDPRALGALLPSFDLAPAQAVAELIGAPPNSRRRLFRNILRVKLNRDRLSRLAMERVVPMLEPRNTTSDGRPLAAPTG